MRTPPAPHHSPRANTYLKSIKNTMADQEIHQDQAESALKHPEVNEIQHSTTHIIDQLEDTDPSDIELRICPDTADQTYTENDEDGNKLFEYQAGTLWITFGDELSICAMATPNCNGGFVAKTTSSLKNAHSVDEHFHYQLYEAFKRTEHERHLTTDEFSIDDVPLCERWFLWQIIQNTFTENGQQRLVTDLIVDLAKHEHEPSSEEVATEPNKQITEAQGEIP